MANLIQLSDDLEFVNKDELIQMSQDPNSRYPSYLVLAEIKRRTMNEKAYAAQQPRPETTVSEEVIQEFAGSQGLGAMAQSSGSNAFPPSDMGNMAPPSGLGGMPSPEMPMQMMAGGGLTGYAEGGRTGYQVGGGLNLGNRDSLSETFANPMENQLSNEELQQILEARNVLPRNEDGSFDKSAIAKAVASGLITATAAAAFLIPEPTTSAFGAARLATTSFGKNLLQSPGKIKSGLQGFMGKRKLDKAGSSSLTADMNPATVQMIGKKAIKDLKIPTRLAGIGGLAVAGNMINDGVEEVVNNEVINTGPTTEELKIAELERALARKNTISETPKDRGNADMLVGLGGAIMSAKNVGELGENISNVYTGIQKQRDTKELAGLQGRLMEAQIGKYEADIANMPLESILRSLTTAEKQLKSLQDSGDVESANELILYIDALNKKSAELQGITFAQKNKRNELLGLVQEVG